MNATDKKKLVPSRTSLADTDDKKNPPAKSSERKSSKAGEAKDPFQVIKQKFGMFKGLTQKKLSASNSRAHMHARQLDKNRPTSFRQFLGSATGQELDWRANASPGAFRSDQPQELVESPFFER